MDELSMKPIGDHRVSLPLRRIFTWNNNQDGGGGGRSSSSSSSKKKEKATRFGGHTKTPKTSNTTSTHRQRQQQQHKQDGVIGTNICIKTNTENRIRFSPPPALPSCSAQLPRRSPLVPLHWYDSRHCRENDDDDNDNNELASLLEQRRLQRRRRRWKAGLMLARHKEMLAEQPPPTSLSSSSDHNGRHPVLILPSKGGGGGMLCFVRYQGLPRHVRYPIGDGTWPVGWWQREIAWTSTSTTAGSSSLRVVQPSPPQLSVDVIWFTPVLKKALSDIRHVGQFGLLLRLYHNDEERAWHHFVALHDNDKQQQPNAVLLPRIVDG